MKRLNRKGFTLVELLAVIVILAIIVGITLVTVLPTLKQSRQKAFQLSVDVAADYLEKQYELTLLGDVSGSTLVMTTIPTAATNISADQLKAAGLKPTNYEIGNKTKWYINTNTGRACVQLKAKLVQSNGGEYYDVNPSVWCSASCTGTCPTS